jgi:hypothetical protein
VDLKATIPQGVDYLDAKVIDYIRMIRFRTRFFGADVEDLWTVVSNIQKYYDEKLHTQRVEYETRLKQQQYEIIRLQRQLREVKEDAQGGGGI